MYLEILVLWRVLPTARNENSFKIMSVVICKFFIRITSLWGFQDIRFPKVSYKNLCKNLHLVSGTKRLESFICQPYLTASLSLFMLLRKIVKLYQRWFFHRNNFKV